MSSYRSSNRINPIKYILITLALGLVVTVGYFSRMPNTPAPAPNVSNTQTINIPASALISKKTTNISVPIAKSVPAKN